MVDFCCVFFMCVYPAFLRFPSHMTPLALSKEAGELSTWLRSANQSFLSPVTDYCS